MESLHLGHLISATKNFQVNCQTMNLKTNATGVFKESLLREKVFFAYSLSEAVVRSCSVKKVFSEISQKSQENTCARVSFLIT